MKGKKAARNIAYFILALGAVSTLWLMTLPPDQRSSILTSLCIEILGAAIVFLVLERLVGGDDSPFDLGRRTSAVRVDNLQETVDKLGASVEQRLVVLDSYTNLEDRLSDLISRRVPKNKKLKVEIMLLDPRSPLVDLRADCLKMSPTEMRARIGLCLTKFLRCRAKLTSKDRVRVKILVYNGILGVAALRFDETIIFSHYLRDKATETSTWMDVRHGQALFAELQRHLDAIPKSSMMLELASENEVHGLIAQVATRP